MKKLLILLGALLVLTALFTACGGETPDTTDPAVTTDSPAVDTTATVTQGKNQVITEDYTATLNDAKWEKGEQDTTSYTHTGTGSSLVQDINLAYSGYAKVYQLVGKDGSVTEVKHADVRKLSMAGAILKNKDEANKKVTLEIHEIELRVHTAWTDVTAKAGSYLMFDFTTNLPGDFMVTVTAKPAGAVSTAAYKQDGIEVTGGNGTYKGVAKCTVPYSKGNTYYINICVDTSMAPVLATVPVNITTAKYDSEYSLIFQGDWEMIKDETYLPRLIEMFYNVYPRVYARFGTGTEPKQITFMADKNYDGVAYNAGTLVCVATDYANSNPKDIGFFAHEITHAVQQYGGKMRYGGPAWFTEFMADFGRFRYYHWGYNTLDPKFYSMDDPAIRDFGYQSYGQHNIFAAYFDWKYPTTKDANGNIKLGLWDSLNKLIKETTVELSDDPYDTKTPFNQTIKAVTGCENMEALRLQFVKDLDEGTFVFTGFRDYLGNFTTENLPGIPNPTYPMYEPVARGEITNPILTTPVTEGENLLKGATIVEASSKGVAKNVITNLFDGDLTTKWQGAKNTSDYKYRLGYYDHEILIDLGKATTFNTYTLYNASTVERDSFNLRDWELFISDDGKNFTSVDLQEGQNGAIISVNVGNQTARYIMLRIHKADQNGVGTARIYEMMLFNKE